MVSNLGGSYGPPRHSFQGDKLAIGGTGINVALLAIPLSKESPGTLIATLRLGFVVGNDFRVLGEDGVAV